MARNPILPHVSKARRELLKSVERAQAVELRPGHYAEAVRRSQALRDECDRLLAVLNEKDR